ncbi:MAG: MFS transporter [Burkholderiales bacterium]|nr:MFS transporter [Burkholderiales bacterium]
MSSPALAPLRERVFRGLWLAWLAANLTMWMHDVSAAWLMTQLTDSAGMVALVSSASTLPVFLLGIASGAMADIVDRRMFFAATQLWVSVVALLLALLALADGLTPQLLLVLTFVNGIALALRWPVFSAIVPDVVPRPQLPEALALGAISANLSRVIGPVVAGALLAASGPAAVFTLNAVLAVVGFWLIWRWKAEPQASALPGERFVGAMRVGVQHVWQSPRMRIVLLRVFLFFFQASALLALLPLLARRIEGGGAGMYTLMMAALGLGGISAALQFPRLRERYGRDQFVRYGTMALALTATLVAALPTPWIALPAMLLAGVAWISTANTLMMSAQFALPNWVRARGMSIVQMALMGGTASGAALWGQVAGASSVPAAIVASALSGVLLLFATRRASVTWGADEDFSPQPVRTLEGKVFDVRPDEGPVMVTVEYQVDDADADEFARVMRATRRARLRQGVLSWGLFRDATRPGRYLEYFVDENWVEHLRRHERFTAADQGLRARRFALHRGSEPPSVQRFVAAALEASDPPAAPDAAPPSPPSPR